jgi:methyl-accepting chemotaxis protein
MMPATIGGDMTARSSALSFDERCAAYALDDGLADTLKEIWSLIGDRCDWIVGGYWDHFMSLPETRGMVDPALLPAILAQQNRYAVGKFNAPLDQAWIDRAARQGDDIARTGVPNAVVMGSFAACHVRMVRALCERVADPERLSRYIEAVTRVNTLESEVITSRIAQIRRQAAIEEARQQGRELRQKIAGSLEELSARSRSVRRQASGAASNTRAMLGKSAEVAAAANQSAAAMRDAAITAAGLIRAIEEARREVEGAAVVAARASSQAGEAMDNVVTLSDHAQAIESIVGLIRDIAGQTNLLALNATIEAARAGDAGRGFAVVASEVKSLAAQTARATDDIAKQIAAIQGATKRSVEANGSIRDTVAEVTGSADRIRGAMDAQAQTVTAITGSVDETALSADSMSAIIASIRTATEAVASEIDDVDTAFAAVDDQLGHLQSAVASLVEALAA